MLQDMLCANSYKVETKSLSEGNLSAFLPMLDTFLLLFQCSGVLQNDWEIGYDA